ncbi:MAG TPA: hypothetical protein VHY22_10520 [Chthoniobacteraceae bacterium]|jgi:probable addiction module antidote protein|nr:hypothetical protein [Chthoniobacteraceae bacterium]
MKKVNKSRGIPLDEIVVERFRDPKRARLAVKLALQEYEKDNDVAILLDTLRLVARAQGGLSNLARKTSVSRQALSEALSPQGNPRLRTFHTVLDALGLKMSFKEVHR